MSVNWRISDLVRVLRTESIPIEELEVGDIVVGDSWVYGVTKIDRISNRDYIAYYDEDGNGSSCKLQTRVTVILRTAVRPSWCYSLGVYKYQDKRQTK